MIDGIRARVAVKRVSDSFTIAKVVVIPRVGRVSVKAGWPEKHFVFVFHTVFVVIFVNVISGAVVVVIERLCDADCKFDVVWNTVAIPIIVCPIDNSIIVVIEWRFFFAPEATREKFLIDIENTVVIVIGVFGIWNTVVIIVNVIQRWFAEALRHDSLVPHCLEESVFIDVSVIAIVIVVFTVRSAEEVAIVLICIVVMVIIGIDFKVIPDTVVVVIDIVPVKDRVVIIV